MILDANFAVLTYTSLVFMENVLSYNELSSNASFKEL